MAQYLSALGGGALIGLASVLMLLFNGKVLGVSGIVGGILDKRPNHLPWRIAFLLGLLAGGATLSRVLPDALSFTLPRSVTALVIAGVLVGYGTRLGSGCTSGHGICGVSRLSTRSLMATATFMLFGALVVLVINRVLGGQV